MVIEGISIHNKHVMHTVCPSLPDVADQYIPFLIGCLLRFWWIFVWQPYWLGLVLLHIATWTD